MLSLVRKGLTILLLYFPLIIIIILSILFFHGGYGLLVQVYIRDYLVTLCTYVFYPVFAGTFSINILFTTPTSRFILYNFVSAYSLYIMRVICKNSPSMKLWAHVFPTMGFSFSNSVSIQNLQFSPRSLCDGKYFLYHLISGFIDYFELSWVVVVFYLATVSCSMTKL